MKWRLLLVAGLLVLRAKLFAQDTNFWVFLCFGQSNMEGFPGIQQEDKTGVDERFKVFATLDFPKLERNKGNWFPAVPPLCRPSTGHCPADYFGRTLLSHLFGVPLLHPGGNPNRRHPCAAVPGAVSI